MPCVGRLQRHPGAVECQLFCAAMLQGTHHPCGDAGLLSPLVDLEQHILLLPLAHQEYTSSGILGASGHTHRASRCRRCWPGAAGEAGKAGAQSGWGQPHAHASAGACGSLRHSMLMAHSSSCVKQLRTTVALCPQGSKQRLPTTACAPRGRKHTGKHEVARRGQLLLFL